MNWEPVYALLILLSTIITYVCAHFINREASYKKRKILLLVSIFSNFSILFLFKYYNFITVAVFDLLVAFNARVDFPEFKLLLPVGISFYTFQAVGYTVDVYYKKVVPEKNFGKYALFVSFFPQLVAGPIERTKNLLPQFSQIKDFDYNKAIVGTKLIIWGFFMKVVVADRLSIYVDSVYDNSDMHSAVTLIVATVFFAIQIYCDFGGYSNIAIGCAKILGFDLMTNFERPYFAKNCSDFWRRWHISLSTWFKDYVYIPLGGNRTSNTRKYANLLITFIVSGLWHGANWTFVVWGALNGIFQVFLNIFKIEKRLPKNSLVGTLRILTTFILINFTWIFFRANNIAHAFTIIERMFTVSGSFFIGAQASFSYSLLGIAILFAKDFVDEYDIQLFFSNSRTAKYLWFSMLTILILSIGVFDGSQFIYFQF